MFICLSQSDSPSVRRSVCSSFRPSVSSSVCQSVSQSVSPSVRPSVRQSVHNCLTVILLYWEIKPAFSWNVQAKSYSLFSGSHDNQNRWFCQHRVNLVSISFEDSDVTVLFAVCREEEMRRYRTLRVSLIQLVICFFLHCTPAWR